MHWTAGPRQQLTLLNSDAAVAPAVARMLSQHMAELFDHMVAQSQGPLQDRLRAVLARLSAANGERLGDGRLRLHLTHADLAQAVGASRQRVSEALRRLQAAGALRG